MGLIQCGGYGQVGRPTDAGREGGRRTVVRASAPSLSESTGQFPVPDGAEPGTGGRFGAGSFSESVPRAGRLYTEREVHHLALPDRDKPGIEFSARQPLPAHGDLTGRASDDGRGGRRREDDGRRREAPEHRATLGGGSAAQDDPACARQAPGEAARSAASAQVSRAGLWGDFEDFGMLGERAEIVALPGVRNAASGTSPPRGKRQAVVAGQGQSLATTNAWRNGESSRGSRVGREGSHELWPDGKEDFGVCGRAPEGRRTVGDGEASLDVRAVPVARERISRGECVAG